MRRRLNLQRTMLLWRLNAVSRATGNRPALKQRILLEGPAKRVWANVLDLVAAPWWLTALGLGVATAPLEAWAPMPVPLLGLFIPLVPASMAGVAAVVRLRESFGQRSSAQITLDVRGDERLLWPLSVSGYVVAVVLTLLVGALFFTQPR